MNETQETIFNQINWRELRMAKFKLCTDGENSVVIVKGQKHFRITYNQGSDLYDLRLLQLKRDFSIKKDETIEGVYCDQLQDMISNFFSFEYVMESLWVCK